MHCRRGDKVKLNHLHNKYCPIQMDAATSPPHVAAVLRQAGVEPGSAVHVMSDDRNLSHFEPLESVYGYPLLTYAAFPHLADLVAGCDSDDESGYCENYLLFAIENEIMLSFPPKLRFLTLPKVEPSANPLWLYSAFEKECRPS